MCKFVVQSNIDVHTKMEVEQSMGCGLCDTVIVAGVLGYIIPHVDLSSLPW